MKKGSLIFIFVLSIVSISWLNPQDKLYKRWESHDIEAIYEKKELDYETYDENGDEISFILVKCDLESDNYEVEIGDKISSYIYEIKDSDLYLKFNYSTYLNSYDEGVLVWDGYSGVLYIKD